jgi:mRNA-degrading endonuclease RelE of RelBE toxin-antitoxin system
MSYELVATRAFAKALKALGKKYPSLKSDLQVLFDSLRENPFQGVQIRTNCYEIRLAITSKAKGKSGGARIITNIHIEGNLVYLLAMYDKSERDNITVQELDDLLQGIDADE